MLVAYLEREIVSIM